MSEELKPCPFCGGKARMHVAFASGGDHSVGVYVECLECRSWSGTKWGDGAQEKAAEAWNRRAERTCHPVDYHIDIDEGFIASTCSECGELLVNFDFEQNPPKPVGYCPNCGAKVVDDD